MLLALYLYLYRKKARMHLSRSLKRILRLSQGEGIQGATFMPSFTFPLQGIVYIGTIAAFPLFDRLPCQR